jgi:hypothetical protein
LASAALLERLKHNRRVSILLKYRIEQVLKVLEQSLDGAAAGPGGGELSGIMPI